MPFTGTGTGIGNADDVFFSNITDGGVLQYDGPTAKWQNKDLAGFVTTAAISDSSITESKLAVTNSPSSSQVLTWNGSGLAWADAAVTSPDATALVKGVIQLTGDLGGTAAAPTVPGLASKEPTITAGTTAQYWRGDKSWQTLDKSAVGLANVDNTSDASKPVSTATQAALDSKVDQTISVTGATSITGGGTLTTDRSLSLVGDAASPGNDRYYGTDGTGAKGFYAIPAGNPAVGGDLSGTASNAQIVAGAVGTSELAVTSVTSSKLADDSVTEPKLAADNVPSTGQVLSWGGTSLTWGATTAYTFTPVNVSTATYTVTGPWEYVFADATTTGITITLPAPQLNSFVRVKRLSTNANGVQVQAPVGSYIDASGVGTDLMSNPYESREYWSDGSNWYR